MKKGKNLVVIMLASVLVLGLGACATTPKDEAAVEVQPSEEDLERQRQEELERQRQQELDRMREEEMALTAPEVEEAGSEMAAVDVDVSEVLGSVFFDFDSYELKPEARGTLSTNAEWLKMNTGIQIQIEGHCDERGTEEYNLALGERRAAAVKDYLVSMGVDEGRLYTISYGEEVPANIGHDAASWAENRRAQFKAAAAQ